MIENDPAKNTQRVNEDVIDWRPQPETPGTLNQSFTEERAPREIPSVSIDRNTSKIENDNSAENTHNKTLTEKSPSYRPFFPVPVSASIAGLFAVSALLHLQTGNIGEALFKGAIASVYGFLAYARAKSDKEEAKTRADGK